MNPKELSADTVQTQPKIVRVGCNEGRQNCRYCDEERRANISGKRAEVTGKFGMGITGRMLEGKKKGEEIHCPPERLSPANAPEFEDPAEAEEEEIEEPEKPELRNFGYGPACPTCRATKGECHGSSCPYSGEVE